MNISQSTALIGVALSIGGAVFYAGKSTSQIETNSTLISEQHQVDQATLQELQNLQRNEVVIQEALKHIEKELDD